MDRNVWNALLDKVRAGLDVSAHSGRVRPGGVFVAVPGAAVDGAKFIPRAVEKGAAYVVAANGAALPDGAGAELVLCDDPREALGELAAARYGTNRLGDKGLALVGVTGTNGKTTIAYILEHLLASAGRSAGVLGTIEYRWPGANIVSNLTTPGCLDLHRMFADMAEAGVEAAVMEASSHALEQGRTAGLVFDAAVFTNLTQDHLDYHGDLEAYAEAKSLLFTRHLKTPENAVINFDDAFGRDLLAGLPGAVGYGLGEPPAGTGPFLRGAVVESSAGGLALDASFKGEAWRVESPLVGRHNASNLLAAMGAGLVLGLSPGDMEALSGFAGAPGRFERVSNPQGLDVFVDYAHTPDALSNVLSALRELTAGRLVAVFGCGGDRDRTKRPLMGAVVCEYADLAVLTSDNPRHEDPRAVIEDVKPGLGGCAEVIVEPDRRRATAAALAAMQKGDVLVVAGKGHEDYQQIGDEKFPFSDVAVIKEILGCA